PNPVKNKKHGTKNQRPSIISPKGPPWFELLYGSYRKIKQNGHALAGKGRKSWAAFGCKNTIVIIYFKIRTFFCFPNKTGIHKDIIQICIYIFWKMNAEIHLIKSSIPPRGFYVPVKPNVGIFKQKRIVNPVLNLILLRAYYGYILISNFYL